MSMTVPSCGKIDLWDALNRSEFSNMKFALECLNPDLTEIRGKKSIFHEAAHQQKAEALKILIQAAFKSNQNFLLTQKCQGFNRTPLQYSWGAPDCAIALLEAGVSLYTRVTNEFSDSDYLRIASFKNLRELLEYAKLQKEAALERAQQVRPFLLPFLHRDLLSIITDYESSSSYNEREWFDAMHFIPKDQCIVHPCELTAFAQIAYLGGVELMNLALTVIGDVDYPMHGLLKTKEPASLYEVTLYEKKHIKILTFAGTVVLPLEIRKLIESRSKKKQESEERVNSNIQAYMVKESSTLLEDLQKIG